MSETPNILVVGSINMDLVVRTAHLPAPGETVLGKEFATSPGGKGRSGFSPVLISRSFIAWKWAAVIW